MGLEYTNNKITIPEPSNIILFESLFLTHLVLSQVFKTCKLHTTNVLMWNSPQKRWDNSFGCFHCLSFLRGNV